MALYKRGKKWWISFSHNGKRIQRSTGTNNRIEAQEFHDKFKSDLWKVTRLENKPIYTWREAVLRCLKESQHKRSIETIKIHLRWLDKHLRGFNLSEIDRTLIDGIADKKSAEGVTDSTVNRMLEVLRAILRKAQLDWEWIDKAPIVRMRPVEKVRIRWLKPVEAQRLLGELPHHLKQMMAFTLATGLRMRNVTGLKWSDVSIERKHALIHPDQSKTKRAIPVPLNKQALSILKSQRGENEEYVFTFKGKPVARCNNHAWVKALRRASIENFRWHDLRHTWASWHVQNGTSLQELQQLGGWSSFEMVLRYAHLSSKHLQVAEDRVDSIASLEMTA